jgi:hypothetical protein
MANLKTKQPLFGSEQPKIPAIIQGKVCTSTGELNVATSLEKYGWEFFYQLPLFGGRQQSGGFVVDFLVYTIPLETPLSVKGEYWHRGEQSDRDALLVALLETRFHGRYRPMLEVMWADVDTPEESDHTILKLFGRAN